MFSNIVKNSRALFPEYSSLVGMNVDLFELGDPFNIQGWCQGLSMMWLQSIWSRGEPEFQQRLKLLAQDLRIKPLIFDKREYTDFAQMRKFYEAHKNDPKYPELRKFVNEVRVLLENILVCQDPETTIFQSELKIQNTGKSFFYSKSAAIEDKGPPSSVYKSSWFLSPKQKKDFNSFCDEVIKINQEASAENSSNENDSNAKVLSLMFFLGDHVFSASEVLNEMKIFDQNALTEKKMYHEFTFDNIVNHCNYNNHTKNSAIVSVEIIASPDFTSDEIIKIKDRLNTDGQMNLKKAYLDNAAFCNPNGITPIYLSAKYGEKDIVESLIKQGVDVNVVNKEGLSALLIASSRDNADIVKLLQPKSKNIIINNKNALDIAIRSGDLDVVKFLYEHMYENPKRELPLLCLASSLDFIDVIKFLLGKENDVNVKASLGKTPLLYAVSAGHLSVVKFLVEQGANLHQEDLDGDNALHYAVFMSHPDIVKFLLDKKVILKSNKQGDTPFLLAVNNKREDLIEMLFPYADEKDKNTAFERLIKTTNVKLIELFLNFGMNVNTQLNSGKTAFQCAVDTDDPHLIDIFLSKGARVDKAMIFASMAKKHNNSMLLFEKFLTGDPIVQPDEKDSKGNTLLHFAAKKLTTKFITFLIKQGYNINEKNMEGYTPLMNAIVKVQPDNTIILLKNGAKLDKQDWEKIKNKVSPFYCKPLFQLSIEYDNRAMIEGIQEIHKEMVSKQPRRAFMGIKDEEGNTDLHKAAQYGSLNAMSYFIEKGYNLNEENKRGYTPLMEAMVKKNVEAIKLLVSKGAEFNQQHQEKIADKIDNNFLSLIEAHKTRKLKP